MTNENQRRWALVVLALIALAAAFEVAQSVLAPLFLAFVAAIVLAPLFQRLERWGFGRASSAMLSSLALVGVFALLFLAMEPFVRPVLADLPRIIAEITETLRALKYSFRDLLHMRETVMEALDPAGAAEASTAGVMPGLFDAALIAPQIGGQILLFVGGLFFIQLCRSDLYGWLSDVIATETGNSDWTPDRFAAADTQVARYFLTISAINLGLGLVVAAALYAIGMPGAILWGVVAGLANYVVYLGAAVTAVALLLAGIVDFDGAFSVMPMLVFLVLNFVESQFVTPTMVGRQTDTNPLLVFVSLSVWVWLWGAIGGIIAIPLLVWLQTLVVGVRQSGLDRKAAEAPVDAGAVQSP